MFFVDRRNNFPELSSDRVLKLLIKSRTRSFSASMNTKGVRELLWSSCHSQHLLKLFELLSAIGECVLNGIWILLGLRCIKFTSSLGAQLS